MSNERHQLGVGHRLKSDPTRAMGSAMNSELAYASYVAEGLSAADMAHCLMLCEVGVMPREAAKELLQALSELHELGEKVWSGGLTEGDIYDHRDAWLKGRLGKLSGWLHTARARREAINLGWLVGLRGDAAGLQTAVYDLVEVLVGVSEKHLATVMPDFTYLQHAHPTTLGHYLLGFAYPLLRDAERLEAASVHLGESPAGSVSTNGTRLKISRERVGALLGFDALVEHNRDAMWQPDLSISLMAVTVSLQTTVDRLAEEMFLWCTHEFGFLELSDAHCRTSVIMPQKKNPYSLAHLRGKARAMPGKLVTVLNTNLTPTGQVDNRTASYQIVPESLRDTASSLRLLGEVIAQGEFKAGRMADAAKHGFAWATELVEFLVETERTDARSAHSLAGSMVASLQDNADASACCEAFKRAYEKEMGRAWTGALEDLAQVFDEEQIALNRRTRGSCGAEPMREMLSDLKSALASGRSGLYDAEQKRVNIQQMLLREVAEFLRKS